MESNIPWPESDDDYELLPEEEGDFLEHPYDDDVVGDEVLIDENGGLTAEGFILLAELEASGAFV